MAVPRSKSAPTSSGSLDLACIWLISTAVGYAWLFTIPSGDPCVMGHKEEYRDENQQQNADAASFHRLESPTRRPQSAFIHSTRTPCSQRGRMQRVPEYHCIVFIEGGQLTAHKSALSTFGCFTIAVALFSLGPVAAPAASRRSGRPGR